MAARRRKSQASSGEQLFGEPRPFRRWPGGQRFRDNSRMQQRAVESARMVLAYHVDFGTYGFWLPNDQRGSGSTYVGSNRLLPYGEATKVYTRRSRAYVPHDRELRRMAKEALKYEPVELTDDQILSVAKGFANVLQTTRSVLFGCSILKNHIHLVPDRPPYRVEQLVNLLKGGASRQLEADGLHPFINQRRPDGSLPSPFQEDCWKVFLNTDQDIVRSVDYTERNPEKHGMPRQDWWFVTKYVPRYLRRF
jgi:REP element-mobilizing transposase RayT